MKRTKSILIAGVGNLLRRDDGLGPRVVEKIRKLDLPDNVETLDLGTLGLSILHYVKGYEKVIFIDTIKKGGKPGSIYKLKPQGRSLQGRPINTEELAVTSMHEVNLEKVIEIGKALGELPPNVVIIGCEPEDTDSLKMGLSEEVEKALPKIIELILEELKKEPTNC